MNRKGFTLIGLLIVIVILAIIAVPIIINIINGAKEEAIKDPVSFETDDWDTIQKAVQSGNYPYKVGDTKTVALSDLGTFTIRIANTTTPSVCNDPGFSQTACGFVIEFVDIITTYNMNPYTSEHIYGTNAGGWNGSAMRTYLTNTVYEALPQELKDIIIDTYLVSGYGYNDNNNQNYVLKNEKLYLLSPHEIWANRTTYQIEYDTAWNNTRQLDYYAQKGVTIDSYSGAIKKYNGVADNWWLRSAVSLGNIAFCYVTDDGNWTTSGAGYTTGVAPAFRIG